MYHELGLSDEGIFRHFSPVSISKFLFVFSLPSSPGTAWATSRAGAVPVSLTFLHNELLLNKQIVERELSFGMFPVLPAFAGYVPDELIVGVG